MTGDNTEGCQLKVSPQKGARISFGVRLTTFHSSSRRRMTWAFPTSAASRCDASSRRAANPGNSGTWRSRSANSPRHGNVIEFL